MAAQLYRCTKHKALWMVLVRHYFPEGMLEYYRCPVRGCYEVKPNKFQAGSQRSRAAAARKSGDPRTPW
jgi:hypothetical protein